MLAGLLMTLRARWWVLLICALASAFGAGLTAYRMPPRYVAKANILMELVKPDPETGEAVPGKMLENYVGTQMRLAASPATTRRMIEQFGWLSDPNIQAEFAKTGGAPDGLAGWLAERVANGVGASIPEGTNLLQLSYAAPDPANAELLADALRAAFLTEVVERKRAAAAESARWLDRQAGFAQRRYQASLDERNRYAAARGIVFDQNPGLQRRLAQMLQERRGGVAGALSAGRKLDADPERRAEVGVRATSATVDSHMVTLQQQATLAGNAYLAILARRNQALQDARAAEANMSAFGEADASDVPVFPNYPTILGGAAVLGFVLSAEVVILLELLNRRVRLGSDLGTAASAELLATIRRARKRTRLFAFVRRLLKPGSLPFVSRARVA